MPLSQGIKELDGTNRLPSITHYFNVLKKLLNIVFALDRLTNDQCQMSCGYKLGRRFCKIVVEIIKLKIYAQRRGFDFTTGGVRNKLQLD